MNESSWFIRLGSDETGPMSFLELGRLTREGAVKRETPVSSDRQNWQQAGAINGLIFGRAAANPSKPVAATKEWVRTSTTQAKAIASDLRTMDFRSEIVPIDDQNLPLLVKDPTFWAVALLGIFPLVIVTITDVELQLTGFALFFAAMWAVIFKQFVVKCDASWKLPVAALFFTSVIGTTTLSIIYGWLPEPYMKMHESDGRLVSLLGFIFQVGVCEELCKFLPVLAYLLWKRSKADPLMIVLIGIFSGLGFAATENTGYFKQTILSMLDTTSAKEAAVNVHAGIIQAMSRSLSCVFGHAVYSGILAYFVAAAFTLKRRWGALFIVGLLVSSAIHGAYDWLWRVQPLFPAFVTAAALLLFYGYMAKLRVMIAATQAVASPSDSPAHST